jgi:hypothetical protein
MMVIQPHAAVAEDGSNGLDEDIAALVSLFPGPAG